MTSATHSTSFLLKAFSSYETSASPFLISDPIVPLPVYSVWSGVANDTIASDFWASSEERTSALGFGETSTKLVISVAEKSCQPNPTEILVLTPTSVMDKKTPTIGRFGMIGSDKSESPNVEGRTIIVTGLVMAAMVPWVFLLM